MKRIGSKEVAQARTFEKLNRDLKIMAANHPSRGRKQSEFNALKAKLARGIK